jgi:pyruvate kinase
MSSAMPAYPHPKTKIVATLGPASREESQLGGLIEAGVDVFRLNAAHASIEEHDATLRTIRTLSQRMSRPVAVLVDLAGPKIRLGELVDGQVQCRRGETIRFVRGETASRAGELVANYPRLIDELECGKSVMLADGTVALVVEEVTPERAILRVMQTGLVRSRQGVNLPGAHLSLPAMSETDRRYAQWAAQAGVDFIGLSFVRKPDEVIELESLVRGLGSSARIIAKIEKQEALDCLPDIVAAAGGVMVARGDLGVETDLARMPVVQKEIIALCNVRQKPVIVATQMLESMQHSRRPTRAEATDVANAILDGCDACMLSGETAIGEYPREAVEMMNRIALQTETLYSRAPDSGVGILQRYLTPWQRRSLNRKGSAAPATMLERIATARQTNPLNRIRPFAVAHSQGDLPDGLRIVTQAVVDGASQIARHLHARLIAVASHSGATALALSKQRCFVPIVGVSDCEDVLRQMCLFWGVIPLSDAPATDNQALLVYLEGWGRREGLLAAGDQIVLVAGTGLPTQGHNMVMVHQVGT